MMRHGNSLIVHVMSAQGMSMKTVTDLYVSLSIIGTGSWRSKVSTNFAQAMNDSGSPIAYWGEHCEFKLSETDTRLIIHVNRKNALGMTENLGEVILQIQQMSRYQPPAHFKLFKSDKERGHIQLEYQFSHTNPTVAPNEVSIKYDKEKKKGKLKGKINTLRHGRMDMDDQNSSSLKSFSSHRSSFSSNASAIEFTSNSPNFTEQETAVHHNNGSSFLNVTVPHHSKSAMKTELSSCCDSIDSSGFASNGITGTLETLVSTLLDETTSPEYLVNVIKHLRKELVTKEDRIRHLELYIDKLVNKVLVTNPELLQASSSPKKLPTIQKPLPTITEPVKPKIILSARMH